MKTQFRNLNLEVTILRALVAALPAATTRNVVVIAKSDGTIHLRGTVPTIEDCRRMEAIIEKIPGVCAVFCNVTVQEEKRSVV
ncbi:MAG: BON domain-containing protein [Chloroflexi bacterium]|nr:MAG: BON domain-containing protein [Chloroflexota bacterium]